MSPGKAIKVERREKVLIITIDRPEARNALNTEVLGELLEAVSAASADGEARAVIVTGAGDRAFISGADIKEMSTKSPQEAREMLGLGRRD